MNKKRVNFRLSERSKAYLKKKSEETGRAQVVIIEELLAQDEKKSTEFVDELANAIYRKIDDRMKSIRIAVNENNKLLKQQHKINNYLLFALNVRTPYEQYQEAKHPAVIKIEEVVKDEIKRLQVIKAEAKRNKIK